MTGIKVEHGKITISSADSLRPGLNFIKFDGLANPLSVEITQNGTTIPLNWRGNQLTFPLLDESDPVIRINNEEVLLPFSDIGKLSLQSDSTWVAVHTPRIGKYKDNSLTFTVYTLQDSHWKKFDKAIRFQPWMNMGNGYGHGSQYNTQPVLVDTLGTLLQRGTVMFSMPGRWELRFFVNGDTLAGAVQVFN
ncbi:hypothetical protein EP331_11485 [bacterium]|nr:MAG: hypothetical protein EP331_11485 [bacterium]